MRRWSFPCWTVFAGVSCLAAGLLLRGQGILNSPSDSDALPSTTSMQGETPASFQGPAGQGTFTRPAKPRLDSTPPRAIKGLHLEKLGWSYNCMECHALIPAKWHYDRPMAEHQHIKLAHGENRFCLNCHHPTNRNAFVDYDGSEIPEVDVTLLCAKCHGPTYRDWKAGAHGRRNGYWNTSQGPQTQLRCIQCHDPHQPQFQPMKPLPPLRYPARAANPPGIKTTDGHR